MQHVIDRRKFINPLEWFKPLPFQELFKRCKAKIKGLFGGNRCLSGNTKIYDPKQKKWRRIDSIDSRFHVWAWDGTKRVVVEAGKPFVKGFEALYEIKLSNGEKFTCSDKHQILTSIGYRDVFSIPFLSSQSQGESIWDICQKGKPLDDRNFLKKAQDFRAGYPASCRSCGGQPQEDGDIAQDDSPLSNDAQEHICNGACGKKDDWGNKSTHTHFCRLSDPRSNPDGQIQSVAPFVGILSHVFYKLYRLALIPIFLSVLTALLSIVGFFLRLSNRGFCQQGNLSHSNVAYSIPSYLVVTSIAYKRHDFIWDFEVPWPNNYFHAGALHHNSGKTQAGAEYVISKCLAKPKQRWWVVAETEEISIDVQQRKIWSLLPKAEVKYCYYDDVNGFRNSKIIFKNGSYIKFKTYRQGQQAFASDDLDGILNDEEPPYDVYREQRMRLIDRDGEMIFTMTSLKGVTELISELYDDHEVIDSEYAPLVDETLPRIVEKNNARFFMLWTTENPYISQSRLTEDIKVLPRLEIKSRIYGIPVNLSGRIYPSFNKKIHVIPEILLPKRLVTLYMVLDPHDIKPWAMQWWAVDKTDTAYCVREYPWNKNFNDMEYDDKTYSEYAQVIRQTETELFEIYGRDVYKRIIDPNYGHKPMQKTERVDSTSRTTPVKELKKLGFKFEDGVDAIEAGHLQVRKMLYWEEKDGELVVQPKIFYYEGCQNSTRHMFRYSQKDREGADGDLKARPQLTQRYKDYCFVAGTMVRTPDGNIPIEEIRVGDMVETDIGPKVVLESRVTGFDRPVLRATFSDGRELIGTPNHKIFLRDDSEVDLDNLRYGDMISTWQDQERIIGKSVGTAINVSAPGLNIEKCGKQRMGKFKKVCKYTTRTATSSTIKYPILRYLRLKSIVSTIRCLTLRGNAYHTKQEKAPPEARRWQLGIKAKRVERGPLSILRELGLDEFCIPRIVFNVMPNTRQKIEMGNSAPIIANQLGAEQRTWMKRQEHALCAKGNLRLINTPRQSYVQKNALAVISVKSSKPATVYNLTVKDRHRYYANDVLVSNCDLTRYGAMAGFRYVVRRTREEVPTKKVY